MKNQFLNFGITVVFTMITIACSNSPVRVCPTNSHYFFYKDKPLVLITSDHHYGAIIDLDFDYVKYLEYLAINGMNFTRIYPGGMYADCWPLMAMYHENNIQNVGKYEAADCGLFTTTNSRNQEVMKFQKAHIKKIVTELNEFDNVIYDICDEPTLYSLPDGSIVFHSDSLVQPWINAMKDAFLQAEEPLPKKHILGQTVQSSSPDLSNEDWCKWLPTEYVKQAEKAFQLNYQNNKPLVNVETNYFGISLTKSSYDVDAVRVEGWWFMLGGGAGCINLNGEFYRDTLTLNAVPAGAYSVEWIDPASGAIKMSERLVSEGGNLKLITPPYSLDIASRINKN